MEWKFKADPVCIRKGIDRFLATGAPLPEGDKMIGRWHAPGSDHGWIIVETDNARGLYEHASEWSMEINWEVTPVLTDEEAGPVCQKLWGEEK